MGIFDTGNLDRDMNRVDLAECFLGLTFTGMSTTLTTANSEHIFHHAHVVLATAITVVPPVSALGIFITSLYLIRKELSYISEKQSSNAKKTSTTGTIKNRAELPQISL